MQKKALLALMLALTMILTGCTLVQKDPAVDAAQEIIRLGDQVVTKGEIQKDVESQLNYMSTYYSYYMGYSIDTTLPEVISNARDTVIDTYKTELASKAQMAALKLDQLSEEEEAQIKTDAESAFKSNLDYITEGNEDYADLSDEEKTAKATETLAGMDYTMETALQNARESLLSNKLREYVIKDVAVSEEEIQKDYDSKVESARSTYENNAGAWAQAANSSTSGTLYYTPAGVRYVKQILVKFKDEDQTKINDANAKVTAAQAILDDEEADEAAKETARQDLEAAQAEASAAVETAFANIDAEADEILAQLAEGADWDTLMAEKTQDPGMQSGITAERGYAVAAGMTNFDSAFVEAAMALKNKGDYSPKTRGTSYGYYIIRYVDDAAEGPVSLDEVRDSISSTLLSEKQNAAYDEAEKKWVEEADFKLNLAALDN